MLVPSPLGRENSPSFEETWILSTKVALCHDWLKIVHSSGSGEEDCKCSQCLFTMLLSFSLWKGCGPSFKKKNWIPLIQRKVCLKLAMWSWSRRFLNASCQCIFTLFSRETIMASFYQTWIPLTQWCFMQNLAEIGPVVLETNMKLWKVYRWTDIQQVIRISIFELWAHVR